MSAGFNHRSELKPYSTTGKVNFQHDTGPQTGFFPGRQSENQLQLCDKGTPTTGLVARLSVCVENYGSILPLDLCKSYRNVLQGEDKETQPNIPVHRRTNDTELTLDLLI